MKRSEITDFATLLLVLFLFVLVLLSSSCARLHSVTQDSQGGTTEVSAWTFFDSTSSLTKFYNRGQTTKSNEWSSGTAIGELNQESSGTNFNDLVTAIVGAAVQGAVKGMKP